MLYFSAMRNWFKRWRVLPAGGIDFKTPGFGAGLPINNSKDYFSISIVFLILIFDIGLVFIYNKKANVST